MNTLANVVLRFLWQDKIICELYKENKENIFSSFLINSHFINSYMISDFSY